MRTSSFVLGSTTFVTLLSYFTGLSLAATSTSASSYALQTTYSGSNFFNGFSFFTDPDPTHGFVTYVNQSTAQTMGLISAADGSPVRIGVDYKNTYDGTAAYSGINGVGRPSVRITSNQVYNHGLFIADVGNMPGGVCGTWPALWTFGPNWPYSGEIDIIEAVNTQAQTQTSLHTAGTCIVPGTSSIETGIIESTNCTYDTVTGANSAGCSVLSNDTSSFGSSFNAMGGGVYAMQWTSTAIKTWFFRRTAIPSDITAGTPNPAGWGSPYVDFEGNCNIDAQFQNHNLVLDTTFCGDWAGSVWGDSCASSTGVSSCSVYVGSNPSAFKNMYWSINSIKVYQASGSTSSSSSTSTSTSTKTTTSSSTTSSSTSSPSTTSTSISTTSTTRTTSSSTTTPVTTSTSTTASTTTTTTTSTSKTSSVSSSTTPSSTTSQVSSSSSSTSSTTTTTSIPTTTSTTTSSTTLPTTTTTSQVLSSSTITSTSTTTKSSTSSTSTTTTASISQTSSSTTTTTTTTKAPTSSTTTTTTASTTTASTTTASTTTASTTTASTTTTSTTLSTTTTTTPATTLTTTFASTTSSVTTTSATQTAPAKRPGQSKRRHLSAHGHRHHHHGNY